MMGWVAAMDVLGALLASLAAGAVAHVAGAPVDASVAVGAAGGLVAQGICWRRTRTAQKGKGS